MLPHTGVFFCTDNEGFQRLCDTAVNKCCGNLRRFGDDLVLVNGKEKFVRPCRLRLVTDREGRLLEEYEIE